MTRRQASSLVHAIFGRFRDTAMSSSRPDNQAASATSGCSAGQHVVARPVWRCSSTLAASRPNSITARSRRLEQDRWGGSAQTRECTSRMRPCPFQIRFEQKGGLTCLAWRVLALAARVVEPSLGSLLPMTSSPLTPADPTTSRHRHVAGAEQGRGRIQIVGGQARASFSGGRCAKMQLVVPDRVPDPVAMAPRSLAPMKSMTSMSLCGTTRRGRSHQWRRGHGAGAPRTCRKGQPASCHQFRCAAGTRRPR